MSNCLICKSIESKKGLIFEQGNIVAILSPSPASIGHILVTTKAHHPILESVPDKDFGDMFNIANKLSILVFEGLGAHGTNLIIENGISAGQKHAHTTLNIVPRKENDGLNLQWQAKELPEEDLSTAELKLKQFADTIGVEQTKVIKTIEEIPTEEISEKKDGEEDYRIKHLSRLP